MTTNQCSRDLHFDDVVVGETIAFGAYPVSADEIIAFARAFDPQPFHLSEEGAKESIPGRLFASGFHTCGILMKLLATNILGGAGSLGSPGIDEVRFLKPVFPSDVLSARLTCLDKRPMRSRPGVGICKFRHELVKASGELVMTWENSIFLRQRSVAGGVPS